MARRSTILPRLLVAAAWLVALWPGTAIAGPPAASGATRGDAVGGQKPYRSIHDVDFRNFEFARASIPGVPGAPRFRQGEWSGMEERRDGGAKVASSATRCNVSEVRYGRYSGDGQAEALVRISCSSRAEGSRTEKWATHVLYDLEEGRPTLRMRGACDAKHALGSTIDSWLGLVGGRLACGRIRVFGASRDWTIDVLEIKKYSGGGHIDRRLHWWQGDKCERLVPAHFAADPARLARAVVSRRAGRRYQACLRAMERKARARQRAFARRYPGGLHPPGMWEKTEEKIRVNVSFAPLQGPAPLVAAVSEVIRRKRGSWRRCYEAALRSNPSPGGKVEVTFTVGTKGTITAVEVKGASGELATCIQNKLIQFRGLPPLPKPESFTQGYAFTKS